MTGLSTTSAATEGFHLIKNNPLAVAIWGIVLLVATGVAIGLVGATVGFAALTHFPELAAAAEAGTEPDRAAVLSFVTGMLSMAGIVSLVFVVVDSVLVTAVKRAVLRPEDTSPGYLRLGADEVRTFLVRLARALIMIALWLVVVLVAVLLGSVVHPVLAVLWCLAAIPGLVFVAVKLSLAVSQSFAERRFNLFGSWRLTQGQFWNVLGAYALAIIFYLIIQAVIGVIVGIAGGNAMMTEIMRDPEDFDFSKLQPVMVTGLLVHMVGGVITKAFELPVLGAPPAVAYRDLADAYGDVDARG